MSPTKAPPPPGTVRPTRVGRLAVIAVSAGAVSWAVMGVWDNRGDTLPGVPRLAPLTLLLIAVALFAIALALRNRLRHQRERLPTARGVDPLTAARALMLAKACSLVGALVVGFYGGYGIYLLRYLSIGAYQRLAVQCALSAGGALLVAGAGLFLEAVLRVPRPPEGEDEQRDADSSD